MVLPGGRALPDVTHEALERLSAVPERADATVPVAVVGGRLSLPLRPSHKNKADKH